MKVDSASFARVALPLALCFALLPAAAQTPREQAAKELARKVPAGSVRAPQGSRARIDFISDSSAGRIDSAGLSFGASSESASVWLPDFATRNATLP